MMKLGLAYYMRQVTSPGGTKHQIRSSSGRVRNAQRETGLGDTGDNIFRPRFAILDPVNRLLLRSLKNRYMIIYDGLCTSAALADKCVYYPQ